jgi:hypothetical protein
MGVDDPDNYYGFTISTDNENGNGRGLARGRKTFTARYGTVWPRRCVPLGNKAQFQTNTILQSCGTGCPKLGRASD